MAGKACVCDRIGLFDNRTGACRVCGGNVVLRLHPDVYVRADELHAAMGPHSHGIGMAPCLALSIGLPARSDVER